MLSSHCFIMSRKLTSGRKRESAVWRNFTYDAVPNKSKCLVEEDGHPCGKQIAGKNGTNLMNHLKFNHPNTFKTVCDANKATIIAVAKAENDSPSNTLAQPNITGCLRKATVYSQDSAENRSRDQKLEEMVISTGVPLRIVQNEQFIQFCKKLDPKYDVPGRTRLRRIMDQTFESSKSEVRKALSSARFVTIGMDIWTQRGYTHSYLAISAAFYCSKLGEAVHVILSLGTIEHPHTGTMIAEHLSHVLTNWNIDRRKVLRIITDNGSNMVKAVKIANPAASVSQEPELVSEDGGEDSDDTDEEGETPNVQPSEVDLSGISQTFLFKRLSCLAHCIQLVVRSLHKVPSYNNAITKARSIATSIRVSSVATQKVLALSGKTVVTDCPTRWSSSYLLLCRLLELRPVINEVFQDMNWDSMALSEWKRLEEICNLLRPFAIHTDQLQTDVLSLPYVLPTIKDLQCHIDDPSLNQLMAVTVRRALDDRFAKYLKTDNSDFDPLPAVACLLSPDVAKVLLTDDMEELLIATKKHLVTLMQLQMTLNTVCNTDNTVEAGGSSASISEACDPPPLKKFKYLSQRISGQTHPSMDVISTMKMEIGRYIAEVQLLTYEDDALKFWKAREQVNDE